MDECRDALKLAVDAGGRRVSFAAGARIFAPGDFPGSWVAIESGRVRVSLTAPSGREVTLYRIGAGDSCLLTTSALIGDEPLPAEGFAETDVTARIVGKATFERLIAEDSAFRRGVLRNYANRVADLVVTMQDVLFRGIPERLARPHGAGKRRSRRGDASDPGRRVRQRPRSREPNPAEVRARRPDRDRTRQDRHRRPRGAASDGRARTVTMSPTPELLSARLPAIGPERRPQPKPGRPSCRRMLERWTGSCAWFSGSR